jgi:tRNA(Ile)-lysidine synthetase-like protein
VRAWMAGDRLAPSAGQGRRRVTRYLSDAGVHGSDRRQWPVVVTGNGSGGDVVWIPGVRRSDAATERSGRPVRHYVCERIVRERIGP